MTSDENCNYTNAYTYGLDRISVDNLLVENEVKTDPRYYLYDGRGSVSDVINAFGQAKDKYSYDPYGEFSHGGYLGSSGTHYENFYGYNGEDYNRLSGLQYLRARYYEPETGRFLTRDTYLGSIMEPLTLNRYAYGVNNPVMNTDPSGHWPKWLSNVTKKVTSAVSSAWSSTKKFVSKAASTVGNAISNAVKEVKSWVAPINENKSNVKTTAENNVYNFKGSLRNTYQNIQQQSKPAITTKNYPIEVVRANMESVKNSCESAQYVKSQKYEYKDKITSAPQTGRSFAAGVGVSLGKNLAVGPMIDVMTAIGLFGESIGTSIKGTGFGVRSDLKQGEEDLENFIIYNFVTDQKSYLVGKIVGDAASTVIGVAEFLLGIPKILVGGIAMTGGILTAQTVVGPIVLGGGGAAVAAVGVAETSYGIDVTYNSLSNFKNDMMSFSEINKETGSPTTNWKSVKEYGHTFNTHGSGAKNTKSLTDRARSTGNNQDQWLDNQKAAEHLKSLGDIKEPTTISIPEGFGQVITPTGEIVPATKAIVVPSATGIKTAYPIP